MNTRRGMALAELCVTLAIVGVVGVMAISFSFTAGHRVKLSQHRTSAQNEITLIEDTLDMWMNVMSENYAVFTEQKDNSDLSANIDSKDYTISFNNGILYGELPDGKSISIPTERIKTVSFSALVNENDSDTLVFCTVKYSVQSYNSPQIISHTFCSNPYTAEAISGGGENE